MNKKDYSIEYSHIYMDQKFGTPHIKGIAILKEIQKILKKKNKDYSTLILIDDYNSKENKLNIKALVKTLKKYKANPDFIVFESELAEWKELLLISMSKKARKQYERYITQKNKIPCSFFIAIWYLVRLGIFSLKKKQRLGYFKKPSKDMVAKNIITILPAQYMEYENKAREIIQSTKYIKYLKKISYVFFN